MSIQLTAGQWFSTPHESRAAPSLSIHCTTTSTTWRAVDKLGVTELPSAAKDLAGPAWPWSTASRNGRTGNPTKEILERHPELLTAGLKQLPGGQGVPGGPDSPIGARALYLWQGNKDTLYRIHGTNEPWKIGSNVSSGCIRMINDDVIDLYDRVRINTKVVVLASNVS